MPLQLIPANEYRRERWRNGQGWTREIARGRMPGTPETEAWDWRLSIAEIEHDCPFSSFPGCDRVLVLLSGNGMRLDFADGVQAELSPPHGRIAFTGELSLACHLLDGPTTDFNAIVQRERCTMQVFHRPLVGSMVFFAEPGVLWAIHLMAGRATVKSADVTENLNAGDTVLLDNVLGDAAARSILDGGGDVLLVKVQKNGS